MPGLAIPLSLPVDNRPLRLWNVRPTTSGAYILELQLFDMDEAIAVAGHLHRLMGDTTSPAAALDACAVKVP